MSPNSAWHIIQRDDAPVTVSDVVADFLASAEVKRLRPGTQYEYKNALTSFSDWCGSQQVMLHQINANAVQLFLEHLQSTHIPSKTSATQLSSHTLASYVKTIKRFLNWCLLDEQYSEQVKATTIARIKKPKLDEIVLDTFTPEDIEALKKACSKEESEHLRLRDLAIIAVLLDTGIRATELTTLTIEHVHLDPKDSYIRVYGKGRKWGEVGLGEESRRLIGKYIRQFREPTIEHRLETQDGKRMKLWSPREKAAARRQYSQGQRLFVNRAGQPLTKSGLYQIITRLGEWAGIEGVRCSPHTFRHTFAVTFIRQGGDIYTLSRLLRHTSVKVTENYLRSLQQTEARKGAKSVYDNL